MLRQLKFRYCEKTTKCEGISHLVLKLVVLKTTGENFSNFCGLLTNFELYGDRLLWKLLFVALIWISDSRENLLTPQYVLCT